MAKLVANGLMVLGAVAFVPLLLAGAWHWAVALFLCATPFVFYAEGYSPVGRSNRGIGPMSRRVVRVLSLVLGVPVASLVVVYVVVGGDLTRVATLLGMAVALLLAAAFSWLVMPERATIALIPRR
ncbi:hypothetical protein ACOBQX_24110 [Actinokineospora sp. G85]|uniref:hypothetical protein n=1 Tax=Actinokineospora sp. G85 TaxID=3406626 RepID=UPI003C77AF2D